MLAYYWELFDRYDDQALDEVRDALRARRDRAYQLGNPHLAGECERLWLGATLVKHTRQEHRDHVLEPRRRDDDELPDQLTIDDYLSD